MLEVFSQSPWLIIVCLSLLIPIFGIIFGTTTNYLSRVRQAEIEASLKHDMLQRGMSAEEIKMVIEATPRRRGKKCAHESGIRREET
jgi:hypothetical protein